MAGSLPKGDNAGLINRPFIWSSVETNPIRTYTIVKLLQYIYQTTSTHETITSYLHQLLIEHFLLFPKDIYLVRNPD
jgi:hypothetical protein